MPYESPIGLDSPASARGPRRCEQTGLTIPECSCPLCWARMQAREEVRRVITVRNDPPGHVIDAGLAASE
jgi:hypothetical protein